MTLPQVVERVDVPNGVGEINGTHGGKCLKVGSTDALPDKRQVPVPPDPEEDDQSCRRDDPLSRDDSLSKETAATDACVCSSFRRGPHSRSTVCATVAADRLVPLHCRLWKSLVLVKFRGSDPVAQLVEQRTFNP